MTTELYIPLTKCNAKSKNLITIDYECKSIPVWFSSTTLKI